MEAKKPKLPRCGFAKRDIAPSIRLENYVC